MTDYGEMRFSNAIGKPKTRISPLKGKTLEQIRGKRGARKQKILMSKLLKEKWANGTIVHSDNAGRKKRKVICFKDGKYAVFDSIGSASRLCGVTHSNVLKSCQLNSEEGRRRLSRRHGFIFFFEENYDIWKKYMK